MTYAEKNFYENDEKKYDIKNNSNFLNWYLNSIEGGTKPNRYTKLEDFQDLIDSIVNWYELKYPGYVLDPPYGNMLADELKKVKDISSYLNVDEFFYRLPLRQQLLMRPDFDSSNISLKGVKKSNYKYYYDLHYNYQDGIIRYSNIPDFIGLSLEEVLNLLIKYNSSVDFSELEKILDTYYFKIELRHRLLELASLKILYKSESRDLGFNTPYIGYMRAKHFIDEYNEELGLLLSSDEIDYLYQEFKDNDKKHKQKILNRIKEY